MALATMLIDPTGTSYTDNEIVDKINAGSNQITRSDAVDVESLDILTTEPAVGEFKVKKLNRKADGNLEVVYDDVAQS